MRKRRVAIAAPFVRLPARTTTRSAARGNVADDALR